MERKQFLPALADTFTKLMFHSQKQQSKRKQLKLLKKRHHPFQYKTKNVQNAITEGRFGGASRQELQMNLKLDSSDARNALILGENTNKPKALRKKAEFAKILHQN